MGEHQIKSKARVAAHGEVFTNKREVNAMLDLVKQETERLDSRFLEPACGDGNFLIEILHRKLSICEARVKSGQYTQLQYEHDAVLSVSSIYGIELFFDFFNFRTVKSVSLPWAWRGDRGDEWFDSHRCVDRCETVRDWKVEGFTDFNLCSDEWSEERHPACMPYAAYGAHL